MTTTIDVNGSVDEAVNGLLSLKINSAELRQRLYEASAETVMAALNKLPPKKANASRRKMFENKLRDAGIQAINPTEPEVEAIAAVDAESQPEVEAIAAEPEVEPEPKQRHRRGGEKPKSEPPRAADKKPKVEGFRFSCDQSALAEFLPLLDRVAAGVHVILNNILIEVDQQRDRIVLTAFNLQVAVRVTLAANVFHGGKFTLPAKKLALLVADLPKESLNFIQDLDNGTVKILSTVGEHILGGLEVDEFPELPKFEGVKIRVASDLLLKAIAHTQFSLSTDDTKQVLAGLNMEFNGEWLTVASTDGHRLSVYQRICGSEPAQFTVSFRVLADLKRLITGSEFVTLQLEQALKMPGELMAASSYIRLETDSGSLLICRLIDGQYPNYRNLIPNAFNRKATFNRVALIGAVRRVALFSSNDIVSLHFNSASKKLEIKATYSDGRGDEVMPLVNMTGDSLKLAFNAAYLLDVLNVLTTDESVMEMNSATSPVVLKAENFLHLLMPVQIRGDD